MQSSESVSVPTFLSWEVSVLVVSFLEATFTLPIICCGYWSGVSMVQNMCVCIVRTLQFDCRDRNISG